jgi:YVTN family beta-propeller protein
MKASWSRRIAAQVGIIVAVLVSLVPIPIARAASSFALFETGQVRPLALSPDGNHLFAVNTPDNRLEIFSISGSTLTHVSSVGVGLEPLTVVARTNTEVWVVNHLSDSVSVVDVSTPAAARVTRTLLVGDEPRDLVFAGPGGNRAFITTAHRGQNSPHHANIEAILRTPGLGRADVWVFDAMNLGATLGGTPLTVVTLFGDTPRALTVSPDGSTVYAAVFHSGNRTTTISEGLVPDSGPNQLPPPHANFQNITGPEVGLIVQWDGSKWADELGRNWNTSVRFSLPDKDVFSIDANANPPIEVAGPSFYTGVGNILFNMITNPVNGKVYVSNLDANNRVRFEGEGVYAAGFKPPGEPATVRGHLAESRITVLDGASVLPRHLNKHIDYDTCCADNPTENATSLAFPVGMAISSDGATLYVAGFGSSEIGIYDTSEIENDTFTPSAGDQVSVTGGGPTGLVLDEARSQLYALTRFDNSISVVSTGTGMETSHVSLHNPEPASVVAGRPLLYDASLTSSHGDSACASCHIFGDFDSLAWDLGNPDDTVLTNPGPFTVGPFIDPDFHPMKGPMTTQSLRGMANHGPMHWRGDRTGGNDAGNVMPDGGAFDEDAGFKKFNGAFPGLLGRSAELSESQMQAFTDFILQVMYPPNPIQNLDNSLTPAQTTGRNFFFGSVSDTFQDCNGCHVTQPTANSGFGVDFPGFFGTDGRSSFENETQVLKIPHLRNMYQKVGMFGMASVPFFNPGDNAHQGDQIRGFGFLHDGSVDTLFRFHNATVFNQSGINATGIPAGPAGDPLRQAIDAFMMAFPSNLKPIVGQQITRTSTNGATVDGRITLLEQRADEGECDVVAKGQVGGEELGFLYMGGGAFQPSRSGEGFVTDATVRGYAATPGQEMTFTCVPPGTGLRIAIDRDDDSYGDGDEIDGGSDPADAGDIPSGVSPLCNDVINVIWKTATLTDKTGRLSLRGQVLLNSYTQEAVSASASDSDGAIFAEGVAGTLVVPKGSGFKYKAPRGTIGITDVSVKEKRNSGGIFTVALKTKGAWAIGGADEDELTTSITLNVGGQCYRGNAKHVR